MATWSCKSCGVAMTEEAVPYAGNFFRCSLCRTALHLSAPGWQGHRVQTWTVRQAPAWAVAGCG